jgi:hypothetical protein
MRLQSHYSKLQRLMNLNQLGASDNFSSLDQEYQYAVGDYHQLEIRNKERGNKNSKAQLFDVVKSAIRITREYSLAQNRNVYSTDS